MPRELPAALKALEPPLQACQCSMPVNPMAAWRASAGLESRNVPVAVGLFV